MRKKRHKSMFSFLAMLVNCTDWWAINNRLSSVCSMQIKSTLECKIKTRALKGIFLVHKWINNTFESNSVWYHIEEISPFCLVLCCAPFLPKCHIKLNSCICQHCDVKMSTVTPTFYYFFYHHFDLLHQCTKFHLQSLLGSFTEEAP